MFLIVQKQTNNSKKSFGYSEFSLFNNAQERRQDGVNFKKLLFIDLASRRLYTDFFKVKKKYQICTWFFLL
jgi:hypothetical protein